MSSEKNNFFTLNVSTKSEKTPSLIKKTRGNYFPAVSTRT